MSSARRIRPPRSMLDEITNMPGITRGFGLGTCRALELQTSSWNSHTAQGPLSRALEGPDQASVQHRCPLKIRCLANSIIRSEDSALPAELVRFERWLGHAGLSIPPSLAQGPGQQPKNIAQEGPPVLGAFSGGVDAFISGKVRWVRALVRSDVWCWTLGEGGRGG